MTEIDVPTVTVDATGMPLPAIVDFDATRPSPNQPQPATELERFEGMRVRVAAGLVTGASDQFGDVRVIATSGPRTFREPGILFPGLARPARSGTATRRSSISIPTGCCRPIRRW